jgi:hypothetical protein
LALLQAGTLCRFASRTLAKVPKCIALFGCHVKIGDQIVGVLGKQVIVRFRACYNKDKLPVI